jgi:hypothetical protein
MPRRWRGARWQPPKPYADRGGSEYAPGELDFGAVTDRVG